jgi:hypothetical protein
MARKSRTKPIAGHVVSTDEAAPSEPTPAELSGAREPEVFDQVIAARAAGRFETEAKPAAPDTTSRIEAALEAAPVKRASELHEQTQPARTFTDRQGPRSVRPNPFSIDRISLEADKNGTQMRLLRFRHSRGDGEDVWIQFDKNPGKDITESVKAAGFRWEREAMVGDRRGAWVMPRRTPV